MLGLPSAHSEAVDDSTFILGFPRSSGTVRSENVGHSKVILEHVHSHRHAHRSVPTHDLIDSSWICCELSQHRKRIVPSFLVCLFFVFCLFFSKNLGISVSLPQLLSTTSYSHDVNMASVFNNYPQEKVLLCVNALSDQIKVALWVGSSVELSDRSNSDSSLGMELGRSFIPLLLPLERLLENWFHYDFRLLVDHRHGE